MKKIVLMLALTALAGCSALGMDTGATKSTSATKNTSEPKKSVSGEAVAVNCGGHSSWGDCNTKATQICPKGYQMIKRDEDIISQRRIMYISCN
jgi:hypothetical protein